MESHATALNRQTSAEAQGHPERHHPLLTASWNTKGRFVKSDLEETQMIRILMSSVCITASVPSLTVKAFVPALHCFITSSSSFHLSSRDRWLTRAAPCPGFLMINSGTSARAAHESGLSQNHIRAAGKSQSVRRTGAHVCAYASGMCAGGFKVNACGITALRPTRTSGNTVNDSATKQSPASCETQSLAQLFMMTWGFSRPDECELVEAEASASATATSFTGTSSNHTEGDASCYFQDDGASPSLRVGPDTTGWMLV